MTWTKGLPDKPGFYAWVYPDFVGLAGVFDGPCGGVCRIVYCGQGFGWPAEGGRYLCACGSEIPDSPWIVDCLWLELPEVA